MQNDKIEDEQQSTERPRKQPIFGVNDETESKQEEEPTISRYTEVMNQDFDQSIIQLDTAPGSARQSASPYANSGAGGVDILKPLISPIDMAVG